LKNSTASAVAFAENALYYEKDWREKIRAAQTGSDHKRFHQGDSMADIRRPSGRQNPNAGGAAQPPSGRAPAAASADAPRIVPAGASGRLGPAPGRLGAAPSGRLGAAPQGIIPAPEQRAPLVQYPPQQAQPQQFQPQQQPMQCQQAPLVQPQQFVQRQQAPLVQPQQYAQQEQVEQEQVPLVEPVAQRGPHSSKKMSARASSIRGKSDAGGGAKKKLPTELVIAAVVLTIMGVTALSLYYYKSGAQRNADREKEQRLKIETENFKTAIDIFPTVENQIKAWFTGKIELTNDELVKLFGSNDKIYNVILVRNSKSKQGQDESKSLSMNKDRTNPAQLSNKSKEDNGVSYVYAMGENRSVCLVMGKKTVSGDETNKAFLGGSITILVKAQEDEAFKAGKTGKTAEEKAAEAAAKKKGE
jgi:hypothetical protein